MALRSAGGMVLSAQLNTSRPPRVPRPIRSSLVHSIPSLTILGGRRSSGWSEAFLLDSAWVGVDFLVAGAGAAVGPLMTSVPGFLAGPVGGLGWLTPTATDFPFSSAEGGLAAGFWDLGSGKEASSRARRDAILISVSVSCWSASWSVGGLVVESSAIASSAPGTWDGSGSGSVSSFPAKRKRKGNMLSWSVRDKVVI